FVDSIFEILGPLAHGVPLVVVCETTPADPDELSIEIEGRGVTNLIAVPSLAAALISQSQLKRRLTALRTWTLSGEVLPAELLQQLTQALPGCQFVNLYGSSEVAADATGQLLQGCDQSAVPIGKPLSNCIVYVLSNGLQPVPVGAAGEL